VTCGGPSNLFPANPTSNTAYISNFPNSNISDNGVAKINYNINSKHTLNGTLLIGNYTGDGEDHPLLKKTFLDTFFTRTYTTSADWVWTPSSRLVNDFRFGYNHVIAPFTNDDANLLANGSDPTNVKAYAINTGVTSPGGLPNINLSGFEKLGTWHNRPNSWNNSYSDFQDSVSYLVGKHTFKFGVEFAHIIVTSTVHDNARGRIDFADLPSFFAGTPSGGRYFVGNADRRMVTNSSAEFVQDDWRVSPKLTLNLGLRYTYSQPIKEANNLWGNFDPSSPSGMVQQGDPKVGPTLWKPDRKNFSPRLGFAYDLSGKGTTVVRGGFSVIYSTFVAAELLSQIALQNTTATSIGAVPTGACTTVVNPGTPCPTTYGGSIVTAVVKVPKSSLNWNGTVFPSGAVVACTAGRRCNIMAVDPNLRTPYVANWNLGVQHAFTNNLSLEVGYVGTHGSRLTGFRELNQPATSADLLTGTQKYNDPTKTPYFPWLNFINQQSNDARSNYHSLQATLTERTSHGLSFTAGYTYGHGLDNGSLNRSGYLPQDSRNPGAEYASGDFDIRHRLTLTSSYAIPGIKGFGQLLEGWKLNTIVTLQTPQPWTVSEDNSGFNFSGSGDFADRWDFFGSPADFKSGSQSIPWCIGSTTGTPLSGKGPTDPNGGCSYTSGVSNIPTNFSGSDSNAMWAKCTAVAADKTAPGTLAQGGCFVKGNSVMTPPALGHFGNMGRNIFRDNGFKDVDFSVFKTFTLKERYSAQFRVEFFNLFNHPLIANPYGSVNTWGVGNVSDLPGTFGCGCASSDIAAGNPQVGSGTPRAMQLGLKLTF